MKRNARLEHFIGLMYLVTQFTWPAFCEFHVTVLFEIECSCVRWGLRNPFSSHLYKVDGECEQESFWGSSLLLGFSKWQMSAHERSLWHYSEQGKVASAHLRHRSTIFSHSNFLTHDLKFSAYNLP